MNKIIILALLLNVGLISCKSPEKKINKLELAYKYYHVLNTSDYSEIKTWFADSLITKEGAYAQSYSQSEYLEFLKWDAVFDPNYKIIAIDKQEGTIKTKISKIDKRIVFLHEAPFITNQIIRFQNDKIIAVETEYVDFNEKIWNRNKTNLLNWIDKNHPELNGFIYDQTESGGIKFLKAIELYKNK